VIRTLLPRLRCPYCSSGFAFDEQPGPSEGRAEFGILRCGEHAYPVVDGIPIIQTAPVGMFEHTHGTAQVKGIAVDELTRKIERGDCLTALLSCLSVPQLPAAAQRSLGWRLSHGRAAERIARHFGERALRSRVLCSRDRMSAREVIEFYHGADGPLDRELGYYFVFRFGQPRHLAALALASSVRVHDAPVLDIACGVGHLAHYFTCRPDPCQVVGLDMNFYHLWIAKHWFAQAADFVCTNLSAGLPFRDATFSATFCSDAYHLIPGRRTLCGEIERCAPGRQVVLTRVGNVAVMPREGIEESLEGYLREYAPLEPRVFEESRLTTCYLRRRNPLTEPQAERAELEASKWLSFTWNYPDRSAPDGAATGVWPHAVGELTINPIYAVMKRGSGDLRLRFEFPSIHYTYENHAMLRYHPVFADVTAAHVAALREGDRASDLEALIESFVVLGVPRRFERSGGWTAAATQAEPNRS
jgi:SAM-dependent methyltransferase/uncharacterized protein YbaR (Trm112 family)